MPMDDAAALESVFTEFSGEEAQHVLDTVVGSMLKGDSSVNLEEVAKSLGKNPERVLQGVQTATAAYTRQMVEFVKGQGVDPMDFIKVAHATPEGRIAYACAMKQAILASNPQPWAKAIDVYQTTKAGVEKANIDAALAREGKRVVKYRDGSLRVVSMEQADAEDEASYWRWYETARPGETYPGPQPKGMRR